MLASKLSLYIDLYFFIFPWPETVLGMNLFPSLQQPQDVFPSHTNSVC